MSKIKFTYPKSFLILSVLLLANCTQRLTDFTIISSKNIDISKSASLKNGKARVEGKDTKHIIVFIPTGVPHVKEALDNAIEETPGAVALTDGVINYSWFYIPYIYGQSSYIVEGKPLIDPEMSKN